MYPGRCVVNLSFFTNPHFSTQMRLQKYSYTLYKRADTATLLLALAEITRDPDILERWASQVHGPQAEATQFSDEDCLEIRNLLDSALKANPIDQPYDFSDHALNEKLFRVAAGHWTRCKAVKGLFVASLNAVIQKIQGWLDESLSRREYGFCAQSHPTDMHPSGPGWQIPRSF